MDIELHRGDWPVNLDETPARVLPRILRFDHKAIWLLVQKYGNAFLPALYKPGATKGDLELVSMDALAFFLWAGLQWDAARHGEEFTQEQAEQAIRAFTYNKILVAVVMALTGATYTPAPPGKTAAPGATAAPSADETAGAGSPPQPGPARVTTSLKRSGSPRASSAGVQTRSGKPRRGSST